MEETRQLVDRFGRRVSALRISLTDHCNFRCVYCMPPEGVPHVESDRYLSQDAIVRFVRIAAGMGVRRVKLTGGEPTVRKDILEIVRKIKAVEGIDDLSLTTNGSRLAEMAGPLRGAGLSRVNISLDSLDRSRFTAITRSDQYASVWAGIHEALRVGFPVKLNVVVLRGMERDEIVEFARLAVEHDIDVRFLEFMPLCGAGWQAGHVLPIAEVRDIVGRHFELTEMRRGDRPAQTFALAGGRGRVGFIASLSEPFCADCSRMRLSADGKIRPCLFSNYEFDIAPALGNGASDADVAEKIRRAVWDKPWGSSFADDPFREGEDKDRKSTEAPFIHNIGG